MKMQRPLFKTRKLRTISYPELLVHVKLTNSCLRKREEYQPVQVNSVQRDSASLCLCSYIVDQKALIVRWHP